VVHQEPEEVFILGQPHQRDPDQRPAHQVERPSAQTRRGLFDSLRPFDLRQAAQVVDRNRQGQTRRDYLHGTPLDLRERGAQDFVPSDDFVDALFERPDVESSAESEGGGHFVGAVRL
jgi:hypothetical protein